MNPKLETSFSESKRVRKKGGTLGDNPGQTAERLTRG